MRNKKTIMAVIALLTGVFSAICYTVIDNTIFSNFFSSSNSVAVAASTALVISGIVGLFAKNGAIRIILYSAATAVCIMMCIVKFNEWVAYVTALIGLLAMLVQILDSEPNKRIFFVHGNGNMHFVLKEARPTYESVEKELAEKKIHKEKAREERKNKPEKSVRKNSKKRYTGYAISPNGRNYSKKRKKKNSKR